MILNEDRFSERISNSKNISNLGLKFHLEEEEEEEEEGMNLRKKMFPIFHLVDEYRHRFFHALFTILNIYLVNGYYFSHLQKESFFLVIKTELSHICIYTLTFLDMSSKLQFGL